MINRKRTNEIINSLESCIDMQTIDVKTYFKDLQELGNKLEFNNKFKHLVDFCNVFGIQRAYGQVHGQSKRCYQKGRQGMGRAYRKVIWRDDGHVSV